MTPTEYFWLNAYDAPRDPHVLYLEAGGVRPQFQFAVCQGYFPLPGHPKSGPRCGQIDFDRAFTVESIDVDGLWPGKDLMSVEGRLMVASARFVDFCTEHEVAGVRWLEFGNQPGYSLFLPEREARFPVPPTFYGNSARCTDCGRPKLLRGWPPGPVGPPYAEPMHFAVPTMFGRSNDMRGYLFYASGPLKEAAEKEGFTGIGFTELPLETPGQ